MSCSQERRTSSESCSPSSREPWTSPTPSLRKPASSSSPSSSNCGVRKSGKTWNYFYVVGVFLFVSDDVLIKPAGGKDGMVGFPDFIYKHIVPACFLAPLKPTFDLSDAQTVLVSFSLETHGLIINHSMWCDRSLFSRRCQSVPSRWKWFISKG